MVPSGTEHFMDTHATTKSSNRVLEVDRPPTDHVRPGWDAYFLNIATAVSARAECTRRLVGAVIVKDHRILGTGYNGAPAGHPSCLEGACPRGLSDVAPGSSYDTGAGACISVHAETNALLETSRSQRKGATMYITCAPCDGCHRILMASGLDRVVWPGGELQLS